MLSECYVSEEDAVEFLKVVAKNHKFTDGQLGEYWGRCNFLDLQQQGSSQGDLLELYGQILNDEFGLDLDACGSLDGDAIYLDDAIHSGLRVGNDLDPWIRLDAEPGTRLRIVVLATHTYGTYRMRQRLEGVSVEAEKQLDISIWRAVEFENRRARRRVSAVYWPAEIPDEPRCSDQ